MLRSSLVAGRRLYATAAKLPNFRPHYGLFINGKEVEAADGGKIVVENPADCTALCTVAEGREADIRRAVEAGTEAFRDRRWCGLAVEERARILNKAAAMLRAKVPEVAYLESRQTGRPIREMNAQLGRLPEWLEYFAAIALTSEGTVPPFKGEYVNYVQRVPLGVVGQITPWNHPMLIAIKKIAPALAAGNSVVVKPSELAPCTVLDFARMCTEAGLPDGVLNVVPGFGAVAGKALAESKGIAKLDLTGGTETGRRAAAAAGANLAGVVMELGGKAPMIVFPDADLDEVVNGAAFASFIAAGQTCIMGSRLLIHQDVYQKVLDRFVAKAKTIKVGNPQDPTTQMGPVISAPQLKKVEHFVETAREEGAKVMCGGKRSGLPGALGKGYYYEPTVIGDCTPTMTVVREEVFGPVVVAYPFKDEAEAVRLANMSPYGLAAAIWTGDVKRAHRVADKLDVGIIWINDHHRNSPSSPWGGTKESGLGRENGLEAWREYTQTKSIVVNYSSAKFDWFAQAPARYG